MTESAATIDAHLQHFLVSSGISASAAGSITADQILESAREQDAIPVAGHDKYAVFEIRLRVFLVEKGISPQSAGIASASAVLERAKEVVRDLCPKTNSSAAAPVSASNAGTELLEVNVESPVSSLFGESQHMTAASHEGDLLSGLEKAFYSSAVLVSAATTLGQTLEHPDTTMASLDILQELSCSPTSISRMPTQEFVQYYSNHSLYLISRLPSVCAILARDGTVDAKFFGQFCIDLLGETPFKEAISNYEAMNESAFTKEQAVSLIAECADNIATHYDQKTASMLADIAMIESLELPVLRPATANETAPAIPEHQFWEEELFGVEEPIVQPKPAPKRKSVSRQKGDELDELEVAEQAIEARRQAKRKANSKKRARDSDEEEFDEAPKKKKGKAIKKKQQPRTKKVVLAAAPDEER